ncbi:adenylate cyclase type 10-like [Plodia interpunctella]|uniref:adenylate cyclase type 10-like n=1 Tax=Plodia interpunctella TaxID=58824 RepID=UPI002368541E|nr:adenylate cyclase type 10-like [Plodia interpunctella]
MNFRKSKKHRRNSMNTVLSSERWRHYGKRPSRMDVAVDTQSDDESDSEYHQIKDWMEECFDQNSQESKSDQDIEAELSKKQTLILSTLVPDEILLMDNFDPGATKRFVGVLLMADVSGYTALSEKYNSLKGGTYRLTVTLNTYLGSLTELIYSHGGDIIKFAGDAFLALWKTDKRTFLSHTIHSVIACALVIQHSFSSYETDVKINLKVKLAISAGNLLFSPIGSGIDMNYVIFGLPVIEAKLAESLCSSGEVKLTPAAWGHCYSRNYDHIVHPDGHVTIRSILYDPREKDVSKPFTGFGAAARKIKKNFISIENLPDDYFECTKSQSAAEEQKNNEVLSLRKAILLSEEKQIGSKIRKFMIRPVLTQIDAHQPLEYLTEMRFVSILFITLKPAACPLLQLITIVNNAYQITCEIVYKSMGCVNKIILFDKDVMILVIFGLRGFKHESEAQAALKCAYGIRKSVSALDGVQDVSIGVTTGQVYCGVVGHPLRREFTVIGAIVNKAARLMCAFKNKITCDESTFVKSKMSKNGFTLMPKINLKGIGYAGNIYEYSEDLREKELHDISIVPPLLNRNDEMEYFKEWLETSKKIRDFDALLLVGESRIGKTRLLEWMARYARNNKYKVSYINLTSVHSATSYLALTQIMNQILGVEEQINGFVKEEKIVQLIKMYDEDLCYLNNVIKVRFAYHEGVYGINEVHRIKKAKHMFTKLINAIKEVHVIFLDDLQNLDHQSWEYISLMFESIKFFTICTVTRGKFNTVNNWLYDVFINGNIRKIVLGPLSPNWISALACQILDVNAVPADLSTALKIKCNGNPGLIESFIVHLFSSGALETQKVPENEIDKFKDDQLQFPDKELLHPQAINSEDQELLDALLEEENTGEIGICLVIQKAELKTNKNVQNIDALIMMQIDTLSPYQQLLLKISSVIGNVIPRELLENIMYENNNLTTAKAIKKLFIARLFLCANAQNKTKSRLPSSISIYSTAPQSNDVLICECPFEYDPENFENLPKYAFCKIMKFRNRNSQRTCYELLPMNQKKEFHTRIVNYLENNVIKCIACGGTFTIVQAKSGEDSLIDVENKSDDSIEVFSTDSEDNSVQNSHEKIQSISIQNDEIRDVKTSVSESISSVQKETAKVQIQRSSSFNNNFYQPPRQSPSTDRDASAFTSILKSKDKDDAPKNASITLKKVTMSRHYVKKNCSQEIMKPHIFDMLRAVAEANDMDDWHNLDVEDSKDDILGDLKGKNRKSFCIQIEKGVSQTDFKKCTCSDLGIDVYEQLIHHAQQAEMKTKSIEFTIRFCYLCSVNHDIENCFKKLDDAESACKEDKTSENPSLNKFERHRYLAQIHALRATFHLMKGNLQESKLEMNNATKMYGINLAKGLKFVSFYKFLRDIKSKNRKYRLHKQIIDIDSIFCLNTATLLYSSLGDEKTARISALWAIDVIMKNECNVIDICDAFTNAIQVELERDSPETTSEIERLACQVLRQLPQPIKAHELCSVGKLFMSTFRARSARGELACAIRAGLRSLTISRFLLAESISLDIIPDLVYVLLARRRVEDTINILQLSLRMANNQMSYDFETWYYALSMDLILDAGFQLEPPLEISRYAEHALLKGKSAGASRRRLVLGLWTYWMRSDNDKRAKRFESEALSWLGNDVEYGSLTTLLSNMRLVEGLLENLGRKIDDLKKVVDLMELRSMADKQLSKLEKDARLMRTVYPRWLLLKAYSCNISSRKAGYFFNQALEESVRLNNRLEEALVRAATSNSRVWLQNARAGAFLPWQEAIEQVQTSWHQILYKITTSRQ